MDAISRDHPKIQVTPEFVYALGEVVVRHAGNSVGSIKISAVLALS